MFNIRMALEDNGQVFPLHFSRCENGVAYFQLAAGSARAEALGEPAPGDHEISPSPIGQAITASEPVPQRRARAQAKPRPRR